MAVMENSRRRILLGESNNALLNLIMINAVMFIILAFIRVAYNITGSDDAAFSEHVMPWFSLPADLGKLATRPWTLLTFMISDEGFLNMFSNMLWLWAFGYILQDLTGNRKIIPIYIYGGLASAIVFIAVANLIPQFHLQVSSLTMIGANTGIIAIAIATTLTAPNFRIFPMLNGGIPLWILTLLFIAISFTGLGTKAYVYHLSYVASATIAFLVVARLRKGKDWTNWMNDFYDWTLNLFNPDKIQETKPIKKQFFYHTKGNPPYKKTPLITQQKVDEILDKILQQGYDFLSDEEKSILKRASEEDAS